MPDYSSLGSFSTGGASALNGELIQNLYDAEEETRVAPITASLELIETETTLISDIGTLVNELIDTVEVFDLFSSGANAFEQVSATTTGEAVIFDAADVGALKEGTTNINIAQIAQKDAYQSITFTSKTDLISGGQDAGDLITIDGSIFSTEGKTYEDLLENINLSGTIDASIEQVSDTEYRLIIKSQEAGISNALGITQTGVDLGLEEVSNHVLTAQNLKATIDGVAYDVSSNSITLDGNLKITASTTGDSSISVQNDDSAIIPAIQEFANKYNELLLVITEELYAEDQSSQDTATLKTIINDIKNMMFGSYGENDDNLLAFGFGFDSETGALEIDDTILGKSLIDDPDKIKSLFIGVAEDKGFGTLLKEHLDGLNSFNGLFSTYEDSIENRKTQLEEEQEKAIEDLDTKYDIMAAQFAAYGAVISQLENSFGGLAAIIAAENSSS
jgi:flagellar hook-associated protein 2